MTTWVLVIFLKVGALGDREAYAVTEVRGFGTPQSCQSAGEVARSRLATGRTAVEFACLAVK